MSNLFTPMSRGFSAHRAAAFARFADSTRFGYADLDARLTASISVTAVRTSAYHRNDVGFNVVGFFSAVRQGDDLANNRLSGCQAEA